MIQKHLELNDISALDFTIQCIHIADAYANDASSVDGNVFAHLAKQLIAHETQPGGPYNDENGTPTIQLNAAIGRLFLLMGKPLPNIDAYLNMPHANLSHTDQTALDDYRKTLTATRERPEKAHRRHASYRRAAKTLSTLDEPIKTQALKFLARIEAADTTHEIAAISHFTKQALTDSSLTPTKLNTLGEANVHSWIAYSIYDHILDKEADAALLPAANVCMRIALKLYQQSLPVKHPLQPLIAHYFDMVDATSAWEITSCRARVSEGSIFIGALPHYGDYRALAWRSCIHILGPLIVASSSMPSAKAKQFTDGLHYYLIARQLGDDIHDWREDLTAGRISAVVALLLERQKIQTNSTYDLATLINAIEKDFLAEGAVKASELILHHASTAREKFVVAGCKPSSELVGLARRLERMAAESIHQQQRFVGFRDEYTANT
jgi:hypothetical protein